LDGKHIILFNYGRLALVKHHIGGVKAARYNFNPAKNMRKIAVIFLVFIFACSDPQTKKPIIQILYLQRN
jgi:hypothetical protein